MEQQRRRIDYMPLADVLRAPRNPKRHNTELIANSISRFGIVESPAIDERTGRLVAGHGRLDDWVARKAAGENPPDGIETDPASGDWMVPVQRGWSSRSDADAEAYLVISNSSSTLGGWDDENLAQLLADLRDQDPSLLDLTGFDADFIAKNWDGDSNPWDRAGNVGGALDDEPEEAPAEPVSQLGDVWVLGRHRLMCGSSTDPGPVAHALAGATPNVVYTDPPYGISIVSPDGRDAADTIDAPGNGVRRGKIGSSKPFGSKGNQANPDKIIKTTAFRPIINDDTTHSAVAAFRLAYGQWPDATHAWWGANYYTTDAQMPNASCWLLWDKENGTSNFADAEMAWTNRGGSVRMFRHMWNGMLRASERGGQRVHPTQKPVALAEWAIDLLDKSGDGLVFDGFAGSGSTLLACERTGRTAVLMELDPGYCDVICKRYEQATGVVPLRDGVEVSFMGDGDE